MQLKVKNKETNLCNIYNFSFFLVKRSGETKNICLLLSTPSSFRDLLEELRMNERVQHLERMEQ